MPRHGRARDEASRRAWRQAHRRVCELPCARAPRTGSRAKQIAAIQTSTGVAPDGIVINPANLLTMLFSKTTTGEYLGDGPFGPVRAVTIWGLPIAVTSDIEAGVALVGCFTTAAQIFRKGGVRVVAVRSEPREALAVYKPQCFGEVTGLN